jgi:chitinase
MAVVSTVARNSYRSDQEPLTFHGAAASDLIDVMKLGGLFGKKALSRLKDIDVTISQMYCCSKEEIKNWKEFY